MSNRLEQEFPHTSWRAIPPVGPRGLDQDALGRYIARGHELRSQAVGKSMRVAGAGLARAAVALAAFVRCAAPGLAKLRPSTTPRTTLDPRRHLIFPGRMIRLGR